MWIKFWSIFSICISGFLIFAMIFFVGQVNAFRSSLKRDFEKHKQSNEKLMGEFKFQQDTFVEFIDSLKSGETQFVDYIDDDNELLDYLKDFLEALFYQELPINQEAVIQFEDFDIEYPVLEIAEPNVVPYVPPPPPPPKEQVCVDWVNFGQGDKCIKWE